MLRTPTCAIGVMAKVPQPGRSKTRLCPPLSPEQAAVLSGAFLQDTTCKLQSAARMAPIVGYAAYAPMGAETMLMQHLAPGMRLLLADDVSVAAPGVTGFGLCLLHAIEGMLADGHDAACVLSSDSPTLPMERLVQAATILLAPGDRVVLGSADDGGYYLLGLKACHAAIFADIAWSTAGVADATRERAKELGLPLIELAPWYDIDDAASLTRLLDEVEGHDVPATRAAIAGLNLWPMATALRAAE